MLQESLFQIRLENFRKMKRREEIVKELKKKSADFESRYGDKADAVMYATATKMAMKGK